MINTIIVSILLLMLILFFAGIHTLQINKTNERIDNIETYENLDPIITLISPEGIVKQEDYVNTGIIVDISHEQNKDMNINMFWRQHGKQDWSQILNRIGKPGIYTFEHIPLYKPFVKLPTMQTIELRVTVDDGDSLISKTYTINYWHPVIKT